MCFVYSRQNIETVLPVGRYGAKDADHHVFHICTGAIDATREAARREAEHAREQLAALPESDAKSLLLDLCLKSVERSS